MRLEILPVDGIGEVAEGDDLAALVAERADLRDRDVVVVSQKVVSKAEGRVVALAPGEDVATARRRLGHAEAARVVVDSPGALIVETRHGFVCANAGVDASNIDRGKLVLLPVDPDASARELRAGLRARTGTDVAVVVADTFGRPWRTGQTDVAIGLAGMPALRDERGGLDRSGNLLAVTEAAVADELAAAADLVRGKADGVPVVVVRGFEWPAGEDAGARALVRPAAQDLFARGRGAIADVLGRAAPEPAGPVDDAVLERLLAVARRAAGTSVDVRMAPGEPVRVAFTAREPAAAAAAGVAAGMLVAAALDLGATAVAGSPRDGRRAEVVVTLGNQ